MDYYRTLHLDREPFSNSPDPGLFFNSKQHLEALQKLEISIRLKRGLNVITGDVGTGKTTLSRQLIQKISHDPDLKYFLILDPGFSSTTDFLQCILTHFTGMVPVDMDDTALKEQIKNYLFTQGVDREITTILMIDEGQKLPVYCLEVLRELLNYETNDHKLLQIIIFAQKEFTGTVHTLDNFKDRINFWYTLSPLGFSETRQFIQFRLDKSGAADTPAPFFSFSAYLAIFLYTRGYPRKIINLCHHVMIRMIIRNRTRADVLFVASCAKEMFVTPHWRRFRPGAIALALLLLSGGVVLLNGSQTEHLVSGSKNPTQTLSSVTAGQQTPRDISLAPETPLQDAPPEPAIVSDALALPEPGPEITPAADAPVPVSSFKTAAADVSPPPETAAAIDIAAAPTPPEPAVLGTIKVPRNETLFNMVALVYGRFKKEYLAELLQANPNIKNPNLIGAGMGIDFPVITAADADWKKETACICLARETTIETAFAAALRLQKTVPDVRILPGWHPDKGFSYAVVVNKRFDTLELACAFKAEQTVLAEGVCETVGSCTKGT